MIERYTLPEMGHIWSEQNKLEKWLEFEILACEALAELGEIPRDAVERIRKNARSRRARQRDRRHHPPRRHRLPHQRRRAHRQRLALRPPRPDVLGSAGHDARLPDQGGGRASAQAHGGAARGGEDARARAQAHRHGGAHARHSRRAHHLRSEAGGVVRRVGAARANAQVPRWKRCRWGRCRGRWGPSRTRVPGSRNTSRASWV